VIVKLVAFILELKDVRGYVPKKDDVRESEHLGYPNSSSRPKAIVAPFKIFIFVWELTLLKDTATAAPVQSALSSVFVFVSAVILMTPV